MYYTVSPEGYYNEYPMNVLTSTFPVNRSIALEQHAIMNKMLNVRPHAPPETDVPDMVFAGNAALFLPRLPQKTMLMANMQYPSRQKEIKYVKNDLENMGYHCIKFVGPEVWEGQGESTWFCNGHLLVLGYGFRSTFATLGKLQKTLNRIYQRNRVAPPIVIAVELACPKVYHLDMAMCKITETKCLVKPDSIKNLGYLNRFIDVVQMPPTPDPFVLNLVSLPNGVLVHRLRREKDKKFLQKIFGEVTEVDVGEFEKGGGSVQCLILYLDYIVK